MEEYAAKMEEKYLTVKEGPDVIHLDYYAGIITEEDISAIEGFLEKVDIQLSRFDKMGVMYASVQDFNFDISICLNNQTVQDVLLGLATNALWDTIKKTILFIWSKIKLRYWHTPSAKNSKSKLSFGFKVKIDKYTNVDFKLEGDFNENIVLEALDKVIPLIQSIEVNKTPKWADFYVFNEQSKKWDKVDVMAEIRKRHEQQNK